MEYEVLNHNNAFCTVTDADIEEAVKSGEPLPRAIVQAMGKTHDDKYLEHMYPITTSYGFGAGNGVTMIGG